MRLGEDLRAVARQQVSSGNPPAARAAHVRLLVMGYSPEDAIELITTVLATEMYRILNEGRPFDEHAYSEALRRLPDLPIDHEA